MKKGLGVLLISLGVLLFGLGVFAIGDEVSYSAQGLWLTITDGVLVWPFLAFAIGALSPCVITLYIGYQLARSAKPSVA